MEIGRYRIVRSLGRGGMAEVFEAIAEGAAGFSRRVAIKRLLPEHAPEPALVRMFLDEARIASRLHHASIVSVLDFGVADGLPFQVLQFVDGLDGVGLVERARARGLALPPELVLHVCTEIAHALHCAHRACDDEGRPLGIVHRDVSPANTLVSWTGDVLLADFGIAFAKDRSERTAAGTTKGTLSYSAPEQVTGGQVDARADVFALAATCHRLLCGRSPLSGEHALADLLAGIELPIDPSIPEDVAAILRRALRRDRAARQPDAAVLADELGAALARRIDRDPRSMLRAFLDGLRDAAPPRKGKLDDLLGLGLELVVVGQEHGVRSFESRTTAIGAARTEPAAVWSDATRPLTPRRRVAPWVAVAGVVLAVGIGGWAWLGGAPALELAASDPPSSPGVSTTPAPAPTSTAASSDPEPTPTPGPSLPSPQPAQPSEPSAPDPASSPLPDPAPQPAVPSRQRGRSPDTSRAAPAGEPRDAAPAELTGTGIVHVGGARAVRAEIRVDGERAGYAPKKLELALGSHDLALVDERGETIASHTLEITPRHTASSPARWIVK